MLLVCLVAVLHCSPEYGFALGVWRDAVGMSPSILGCCQNLLGLHGPIACGSTTSILHNANQQPTTTGGLVAVPLMGVDGGVPAHCTPRSLGLYRFRCLFPFLMTRKSSPFGWQFSLG